MAIEHARARLLPKPWGMTDVRPWSIARHDDQRIGEIWYERAGAGSPNASLLLKLLFTDKPLSVQVHPDDGFAQALGLPRGKTEAWYVLSAAPGAKVALGLNQYVTCAPAARSGRQWVDRESSGVASRIPGRCASGARRDDTRDRRRPDHCRASAEQRCDLSPVRLRQRARASYRKCGSGRDCRAGGISGATHAGHRRADDSCFQSAFCPGENRSVAQLQLAIGKSIERPGFLYSAATPKPDHSISRRAMPFSQKPIASNWTPGRPGLSAWSRTPEPATLPSCCRSSKRERADMQAARTPGPELVETMR